MPSIGLNVMVIGLTTQTVRNVDGDLVLDFFVEENLGEREPRDFWLEARHNANHTYLANKTNAINQNIRSTSAILMGSISYIDPIVDPRAYSNRSSINSIEMLRIQRSIHISVVDQIGRTDNNFISPNLFT